MKSRLIDACVMECYFREHMAERDILFHDGVAKTILSRAFPTGAETGLSQLLSLHAPTDKILSRLQTSDLPEKLRLIPYKSPELLGLILKEGIAGRVILQDLYHNSRNEQQT